MEQRVMLLSDLLARAHHDASGGRVAKAELPIRIEGASSKPVWRIVLIDG